MTFTLTDAEKESQVTQIQFDRKIMEKEKLKEMSRIENESHLAKVKAQADAEFYLMERQAEANKVSFKLEVL